jgi:DNA-binding MarR family transcriptional regulator
MTQLAAPATQSSNVDPLPDQLVSASAKLVYLYLDRAGSTTISELAVALDMRKLSLYSVLDALAGKDLVERDGETYAVAT